MKNILIDMAYSAKDLQKLKDLSGVSVEQIEPADAKRELPRALIHNKHVLFCLFPPKNLDDMGALEFIQLGSAGYSQLYGLNLAQKNIQAANAAGVNDIPIAEWNIAMMINLTRNLRRMISHQEKAIWDRSAIFQQEVRGRTLGIWGYGGIGRETARLAKTMGLTIHALDAQPIGPRDDYFLVPGTGDPQGRLPDKTFTLDQKMEFLADLDFLILSMPLTPQTEGIIGPEELSALPKTAYVLNPARGPLIQEQALLQALRNGSIAGAALDTHYYYPLPPEHPLWRFPNVILTPHISGSTNSTNFSSRVAELFYQNIQRYLVGSPLVNSLSNAQLQNA